MRPTAAFRVTCTILGFAVGVSFRDALGDDYWVLGSAAAVSGVAVLLFGGRLLAWFEAKIP